MSFLARKLLTTNGIAPPMYFYNYGTVLETGSWTYTTIQNNSTHAFTQNSNNLYLSVQGSGSTGIWVGTKAYHTTPLKIPATHNKMDVYCYSIALNGMTQIWFGLTTNNNDWSDAMWGSSVSTAGVQAVGYHNGSIPVGSYGTITFDITAAQGKLCYFIPSVATGQNGNVQIQIYSARTYFG